MYKQENKEVEVDLFALLNVIWKKKILIVLVALLGGALAFGFSRFVLKPSYSSTTRIYVVNRQQENGSLTNQDLQAGSYLVKDYKEIILSSDVLKQVKDELGYTGSSQSLAAKVSVNVPTDTRIVSITVRDGNPEDAAQIANSIRKAAATKIIEITKVSDVTTLEEASVPNGPSAPNIRRNTMLGIFAGAGITILILLTAEVLDDRVKRAEDVEERMNVVLLGVVPNLKKLK